MKSDYWWFTLVVTQSNTYSKDKYIIKVCKKLRGEMPDVVNGKMQSPFFIVALSTTI
jgi:hypothetical protein